MSMKDVTIHRLQKEARLYWEAINQIADHEFDRAVKPWLVASGNTFSAAMGGWAVYTSSGTPVGRSSIPNRVLEILEISVPLYDHELGSLMPEYPED